MEQYYAREDFWQDVASKSGHWYREFSRLLSPAVIGGVYSHFYDINQKDAEIFFDQLSSGNDVTNNSIKTLRKKLIEDRTAFHKIPYTLKMVFILKTWNAFRTNKVLKVLKFDENTEEYPTAI